MKMMTKFGLSAACSGVKSTPQISSISAIASRGSGWEESSFSVRMMNRFPQSAPANPVVVNANIRFVSTWVDRFRGSVFDFDCPLPLFAARSDRNTVDLENHWHSGDCDDFPVRIPHPARRISPQIQCTAEGTFLNLRSIHE
jgi:hypothetical protein